MYSDSFILITMVIVLLISTGCIEYAYNVVIELIPYEIYLIHKSANLDS